MIRLTCCFLAMHFVTAFAQPKKLTAESNISAVTVFSSGAQILRTATVSVLPGKTEIVFGGLSNQLEQQSIQLKADAAITLLSVQAVKDYTSQRKVEADERSLLDSRLALQDKLAADNRLLQVYKREEEMLTKNQSIGGQAGVKTEELKQALDLHRARLTEVLQKQLEIEKRILAQQKELAKLSAQIAETGKKKDSVNYTVTALISSRETQSVKFSLLYTVKDAGWYPTYDVRVADITKPLDVLMNANVFQRSGETWKDVAVQLSTGNPVDNATPSTLQPWTLGFYDASVAWQRSQATVPGVLSGRVLDESGRPLNGASVLVKGTGVGTATDVNGFFKLQNLPANAGILVSSVGYSSKEIKAAPGYLTVTLQPSFQALEEVVVVGYGTNKEREDDDEPKRKKSLTGSVVSLQSRMPGIDLVAVNTQYQPTATVYKIDEKYTLETDGKTTTIALKRMDVPALYEYLSVPKLDPSAFLTAKVVNWQDYDLQSGESNLYFEGTFLGKTYIDLSTAGDTLALSLGKDNSIKVTRKLLKEFNTKKFIGSNRTEAREYEITVMNTKRVPALVIVQDQFPVSVLKEIEVKDKEAREAQVAEETGSINWTLNLQPGQEKKVKMGYSVKYPKDRRLILEP